MKIKYEMKNLALTIIFVVLLCTAANSQIQSRCSSLIFSSNKKFGLKDEKGNVMVAPIYDRISGFKYNVAIINQNSKLGLIDCSGKVLVSPRYDKIAEFDNSTKTAHTMLSGKKGIIDITGKEILSPIYDEIEDLQEGMVIVAKSNCWGVVEVLSGKLILPIEYQEITKFKNQRARIKRFGKYGYINTSCEVVVPPRYEDLPDETDYYTSKWTGKIMLDSKIGFMDTKTYQVLIPPKYEVMWDFVDKLAPVMLNGKWGIIDEEGKELISTIYDEIDYFKDGIAKVRINNKWGFVDKSGKLVVPLIYDQVNDYKDEYSLVQYRGHWIFIDKQGVESGLPRYCIRLSPKSYLFKGAYSEGLASACRCEFKLAGFSQDYYTNFQDYLNCEFGYVDIYDSMVIVLNQKYTVDSISLHDFSEGMAVIQSDTSFGFINHAGQIVIPCVYMIAGKFSDGLAFIAKRNIIKGLTVFESGYLDKCGNMVIKLESDLIKNKSEQYFIGEEFKNGVARITLVGNETSINEPVILSIDTAGKILSSGD